MPEVEGENQMNTTLSRFLARRRFLAGMGTGVTAFGAMTVGAAPATAQSAGAVWTPTMHPQDEWLDKIPGKHRFVFDTTTSEAMNSVILYAGNYYNANQSGYGLKDADLAVVIVARHFSTPFAYNDSIWAKYGTPISSFISSGKEPAKANAYTRQLTGLTGRGAHLAVCQMATRLLASTIARSSGDNADAVYKEIEENLLPNSHLVSAGIVAVNRAQEHGYAFAYAV
jgi:intracellular sulfur oxidation DsrE/DsrF family protein